MVLQESTVTSCMSNNRATLFSSASLTPLPPMYADSASMSVSFFDEPVL
jgi:hypothetical protein